MKIFNSTKEEVEDKKYNIFIGISMGIKPFNETLVKDYLNWALKHTKSEVIILIADSIARINYRVFSGYNEKKSCKRALKEGDSYLRFFKKILTKFPKEKRKKIKILRWDDIFNKKLEKMSEILEKEFLENKYFRKQILYFVKDYAKRRRKKLNKEKLDSLARYMLLELPTMLNGIEVEGIKYNLLFYPAFVDSGMARLVLEIENSKAFSELRKKLELTENAVLVEAYILNE